MCWRVLRKEILTAIPPAGPPHVSAPSSDSFDNHNMIGSVESFRHSSTVDGAQVRFHRHRAAPWSEPEGMANRPELDAMEAHTSSKQNVATIGVSR